MAKIAPYVIGGLAALLIADFVPVPSPSQQFMTFRAGNAAPAPVFGTPDSNVNRSAKGNRELFLTQRLMNPVDLANTDIQSRDRDGVVRTVPSDASNEPASEPKPPARRKIKLPIGCESAFSSVAAPSLAHHIGRCMS